MSASWRLTLAVNAPEEGLDAAAAFCRHEAIGLEATAFAFPSNLDSDSTWAPSH